MTEPIKVVCAWCGATIHDGPTPTIHGTPRVSHGICPACSEKLLPKEPKADA